MPLWVQIITAIGGILGLGAAGGSPFFIRAQLRKFSAEGSKDEATAAETIQRGAQALLQPAIERAVQLDHDLKAANKLAFDLTLNLASANAEIADLRNQMNKMSKELVEKSAEIERLTGGGSSALPT